MFLRHAIESVQLAADEKLWYWVCGDREVGQPRNRGWFGGKALTHLPVRRVALSHRHKVRRTKHRTPKQRLLPLLLSFPRQQMQDCPATSTLTPDGNSFRISSELVDVRLDPFESSSGVRDPDVGVSTRGG